METIIEEIENLTLTARKSIYKPYKSETVNEKLKFIEEKNEEFTKILADEKLDETELNNWKTKFEVATANYKQILQSHIDKRQESEKTEEPRENTDTSKNTLNIQPAKMETAELVQFMKLIPVFTGDKTALDNFISTIELLSNSMTAAKRDIFFSFVLTNRIDVRVRNKIKQIGTPTDMTQLVKSLKQIFKTKKTENTLLNEITRAVQGNASVDKFAENIENLITDLIELQITDLGEECRETITSLNYKIGFNAFKNGLNDKDMVQTLEASRVRTLQEALQLAEEMQTSRQQQKIMYQTAQSQENKPRNNHRGRGRGRWYSNNNHDSRNQYQVEPPYQGPHNSNRGRQNNIRGRNHNGNYNNRNRNNTNNDSHNYHNNRNGNYTNNSDRNYDNNHRIHQIQNQENPEDPEMVRDSQSPDEEE